MSHSTVHKRQWTAEAMEARTMDKGYAGIHIAQDNKKEPKLERVLKKVFVTCWGGVGCPKIL